MAREKVEKFKLTKEQVAFTKVYKQQKRVGDFLRALGDANPIEHRQKFADWVEDFKAMAANAPKNKVKELSGQEEG
jgi:hypothetical protein